MDVFFSAFLSKVLEVLLADRSEPRSCDSQILNRFYVPRGRASNNLFSYDNSLSLKSLLKFSTFFYPSIALNDLLADPILYLHL